MDAVRGPNGFAITILYSQAGDLRGDRVSGVHGVTRAGTASGDDLSRPSCRGGATELRLAAGVRRSTFSTGGRDAGSALQLASAGGQDDGEVGAVAAPGVIPPPPFF